MRRVLCFIIIFLSATLSYGRGSQDFASHFMQICKEDTAIHCITVSPHMMGQMLKTHNAQQNEDVKSIISKLKSARILTAYRHGEDYYQTAEQLLEKNSNRFRRDKYYHNGHNYGCFYLRERKGKIVELVMLHTNKSSNNFVAINLTGTIDEEFIRNLTNVWGGKTASLINKR